MPARASYKAPAAAEREGSRVLCPPLAFARPDTLERAELLDAPVRWPRPSRLLEPLTAPGKRAGAALRTLGLHCVEDLLEHLPVDSREARRVADLREGEQATVAVEVRSISKRAVRRRGMRPLVEATVFDASGSMRVAFFNQPWLLERYPAGTRLLLHGKADGRGRFGVAHHAPSAVELGPGSDGGGTPDSVAHYPASDGITSTQLLTLVADATSELENVPEFLSAGARVAEQLPDRAAALRGMHFPRDGRDAPAARRRLAFDELLLTQLLFLRRRAERRAGQTAHVLGEAPSQSARWLAEQLPFTLTGDQQRALETIDRDLAEARPMQRLLMGEVGSGKTVLAVYAMLRAAEHGRQAALMAPTETLAEQHFATIQRLLGSEPVRIELLTSSTRTAKRRETLARLAGGELSMIVGTHALIEPDVRFSSLALAVIDEQHRFGVRQREALIERAGSDAAAHVLHMTATPIPRTLSLARYGDLDTTVLRELPAGRRPITTKLASGERERAAAYERLREELLAGRQAYVVCPLIDEAEETADGQGAGEGAGEPSLKAASAEVERLAAGELAGSSLALLHGGMKAAEKQAVMSSFASGEVQVLVATTVIEVGIDVPNATVMLIENAERFGISQLHQLRGRVGRGEHASHCFLMGPAGVARLRALVAHTDGFRLADIDLELRKEGDLIGTRQSGLNQLKVARLPEDAQLQERARARAEAIMAFDAGLQEPEHFLLGAELKRRFGERSEEPLHG
jgi:ATP-dependent DNA helicase RecG